MHACSKLRKWPTQHMGPRSFASSAANAAAPQAGAFVGIDCFGASAPGQTCLDNFGFTSANVASCAIRRRRASCVLLCLRRRIHMAWHTSFQISFLQAFSTCRFSSRRRSRSFCICAFLLCAFVCMVSTCQVSSNSRTSSISWQALFLLRHPLTDLMGMSSAFANCNAGSWLCKLSIARAPSPVVIPTLLIPG